MVKPVLRRKSIGTKVSEEEYARLEALAGGRAMSEWVREVLARTGWRAGEARRTDVAGGSLGAAYDPAECVLQAGRDGETDGGRVAVVHRPCRRHQGAEGHRAANSKTRQLKEKTNSAPGYLDCFPMRGLRATFNNRSVEPATLSCSKAHSRRTAPKLAKVRLLAAAYLSNSSCRAGLTRTLT
jgi:hypothetical protein